MAQLRGTKRKHQEGIFSNYCGFGGSGIPQHEADEICQEHDINYGTIQEMGQNPYTSWNWADEMMLTRIRKIMGKSPKEKAVILGARAFLAAKKAGFPEGELQDKSYIHAKATEVTKQLDEETKESPFITPVKRKREPEQTISPLQNKKQNTASLSNSPSAEQDKMGDVVMRDTDGSEGHGKTSGETPLSKLQPHYGLPQAVNAVLPVQLYYSQLGVTDYTSTVSSTRIRMNSIYDMMVDSLTTPTTGTDYTSGRYSVKVIDATDPIGKSGAGAKTWGASLWPFPVTGTGSSEKPQWREWYNKMYDYYHVLGVEYEVTIQNAQRLPFADIAVGIAFESSSATNTTSSIPNGNIIDMRMWPGIEWKVAPGGLDGTSNEQFVTFKGYHKTGNVHRSIENDEDVKTWTKTDGSTPSLTEFMKIYIGMGDFNSKWEATLWAANVRVKLRLICQYKQLKQVFRYPSNQAAVTLSAPGDIKWSG